MRLEPIPSAETLAEHYALRFHKGNYEVKKIKERISINRGIFRFAMANFTIKTNGKRRIFDIGCFAGELLDIAKSHGWETWGIDLQENAVRVAMDSHANRILEGAVESFEPDSYGLNNYFDLVIAAGVIEHLLEPDKLFRVAQSLLKNGGIFIIQTPDTDSLPARLLRQYWLCLAAPEHTYYFSKKQIARLGTRFGFKLIRRKPHFKYLRLNYVLEQMVFFGTEVYRVFKYIIPLIPDIVLNSRLYLYGGEMLLVMVKTEGQVS
jgi:2-polyprenyl-3-methyl-5-hydroxy-6-metoxy-1,4-benzoquinol methylase